MVFPPNRCPFCLALLCLAQLVAGWGRAVHSLFAFPPAGEAGVAELKPEVMLCLSFSNNFLSSFFFLWSKKRLNNNKKIKPPTPSKTHFRLVKFILVNEYPVFSCRCKLRYKMMFCVQLTLGNPFHAQ